MSTGAGYGVDSSQVTKVSGDYQAIGDTIVQLAGKAETSIGSGQVGPHYATVGIAYQQVFQDFAKVLTSIGNKVLLTGGSLGQVAGGYSQTEDANTRNLGSA